MSHISVYRRWRPQTFEEVIGQERITRTLQNAIQAGRVTHAYLFAGHRGTGKTTVARILAKALNCVQGPTPHPDNTCPSCQAINQGSSLDVIEIDGASHTQVDHIRELKEKIVLAPAESRYKVYIIDEVHMLSTSAFNALLKTLEEPPPHAVFVLVTTEPHKIPATVASRCQRFDFRRVPLAEIEARLRHIAQAEGFAIDDRALRHIARLADGSVRDAESVLDQLGAYKDERITTEDILSILGAPAEETLFALADALLHRNPVEVLRTVSGLLDEGKESRQIMRTLLEHFRDLLIAKVAQDPAGVLDTTPERLAALRQQAAGAEVADLLRAAKILSDADVEARAHSQPRLLLEIALIRLARPEMDPTLEGLQARIHALESGERPPRAPTPPGTSPSRDLPPPSAPPRRAPAPARRAPAPPGPAPSRDSPPKAAQEAAPPALTLQDVRNRWARVLEEVKRLKMFCHALLIEGVPLEVRGGTLVVGLRSGYNFHVESLHRPENRLVVEQALERVFGRRLALHCQV
ncbi:MAG: DNA polymerase III subunit gamma/tau, partial [Armatimonadota bacterium]|nr:DNA polymerase III subunit gamma/tau [Armatimonadota bacterium]